MKRMKLVWAALLLVPTLALADADPTTADGWYTRGEDHYNVGEFDEAIGAFKKGFALETVERKKAAYLYNIAQAYRVQQNCAKASFFYKRFLEFKDKDKEKPLSKEKRKEVENFIAQAEECMRTQTSMAQEPPDSLAQEMETDPKPADTQKPPDTVAVVEPSSTTTEPVDTGAEPLLLVDPRPRTFSARVNVGLGMTFAGDTSETAKPGAALIAGYPLPIGPKMSLELGIGASYAAIGVEDTANGGDTSATLIGVGANVGLTYFASNKLGIRGDLGLGVGILTGASETTLTEGAMTTGALAMPRVRIGAGLDYAITRNVVGTIAPAFAYAIGKEGLPSSFLSVDLMIGIGYRL